MHSPPFSADSAGVVLSSLSGNAVHAVIQVTKDMQPVVFSRWTVPLSLGVEPGVADLTLEQLLRIGKERKLMLDMTQRRLMSAAEWAALLDTCLIPLSDLLQMLPSELGISLELAYASPALCNLFQLNRCHDLNAFVDSVLSSVYSALSSPDEARKTGKRRKLVFSSFSPDVCAALNWKQPNCKSYILTNLISF